MSRIVPYKNSISEKSKSAPADDSDASLVKVLSAIEPLAQICQTQPIGYVVELGSNEAADRHLVQARQCLSQLAKNSVWSTEFVNPDYTATEDNPKPDYTNQCGYLIMGVHTALDNPSLGELIKTTKIIEKQIQNEFFEAQKLSQLDVHSVIHNMSEPKNRRVIIDIDVLAIKTADNELIGIAERYPFKHHEWVGLQELHQKGHLE
uniref:6-hydroxymethyl-7,8-dihydropterin pyrophosphokinase n=1 Tax=Psychrobacter sp. (strain PRwf-1) TaxID=349106 RepID=A5WEV1_PSYWF